MTMPSIFYKLSANNDNWMEIMQSIHRVTSYATQSFLYLRCVFRWIVAEKLVSNCPVNGTRDAKDNFEIGAPHMLRWALTREQEGAQNWGEDKLVSLGLQTQLYGCFLTCSSLLPRLPLVLRLWVTHFIIPDTFE